jgi:hypothetical protein
MLARRIVADHPELSGGKSSFSTELESGGQFPGRQFGGASVKPENLKPGVTTQETSV